MDALLTAFVTAALAEWGDKTQLIVAMLAASTRRPRSIFAGLLFAAAASSILASIAGVTLGGQITIRAMSLMVALALLFAGLSGLIRRSPPVTGPPPRLLIGTAAILCFASEMADQTQFLTFALAARFDNAPLAAAGATAGILASCVPAILLGDRLSAVVPVSAIRYAVAGLFLLAGFIVGVSALRLI
jgi:putative Ca2+/H+ antiporter (TMEM165/GDT1 family)